MNAMTNRQIAAAVYTGKSLTAYDADLKADARRARLTAAQSRQHVDHAGRIAATLVFARMQHSGFRHNA